MPSSTSFSSRFAPLLPPYFLGLAQNVDRPRRWSDALYDLSAALAVAIASDQGLSPLLLARLRCQVDVYGLFYGFGAPHLAAAALAAQGVGAQSDLPGCRVRAEIWAALVARSFPVLSIRLLSRLRAAILCEALVAKSVIETPYAERRISWQVAARAAFGTTDLGFEPRVDLALFGEHVARLHASLSTWLSSHPCDMDRFLAQRLTPLRLLCLATSSFAGSCSIMAFLEPRTAPPLTIMPSGAITNHLFVESVPSRVAALVSNPAFGPALVSRVIDELIEDMLSDVQMSFKDGVLLQRFRGTWLRDLLRRSCFFRLSPVQVEALSALSSAVAMELSSAGPSHSRHECAGYLAHLLAQVPFESGFCVMTDEVAPIFLENARSDAWTAAELLLSSPPSMFPSILSIFMATDLSSEGVAALSWVLSLCSARELSHCSVADLLPLLSSSEEDLRIAGRRLVGLDVCPAERSADKPVVGA